MPKPQNIKYLVLHITAGAWGTVESIRRFHMAPRPVGRGWRDIGYHWLITNCYPTYESYAAHRPEPAWDGMVWPGRDLDRDGDVDEEIGAHAYGYNSKSLGIALVGINGIFTAKQILAALDTCYSYTLKYRIPLEHVIGHYETGNTKKSCPQIDMDYFRKLLAKRGTRGGI